MPSSTSLDAPPLAPAGRALSPRARALSIGASYALLVAAGPGALSPDGSWRLGLIALAPWISAASRPGPRAFVLEWLLAAAYFTASLWWIGYIFVPALLIVAVGMGAWLALAGWLARALPVGWPRWLVGTLGWVGAESARSLVPHILGTGWLQLGHLIVDAPAIAGSARVWGLTGLSLVAAATAGALADLIASRWKSRAAWIGFAPLALALALSRATAPPATEPGPSVLAVQPAFAQARKQYGDPTERFRDALALTREALDELARAGTPVDLVCWGETMLPLDIAAPELADAIAAGARTPSWRAPIGPRELASLARAEQFAVGAHFFGLASPDRSALPRLLPEGTSLLAGVECLQAFGASIRRTNAAVVWNADGRRQPPAPKRYLVPGGETMFGLERLAPVRKVITAVAGYVPDLAAGSETGVLEVATAGGARYRFGATICFDNAFAEPYANAAANRADFHVVLSNEAWYRASWELDQMVAFSRVAAIATGRSFLRVTNSGVTVLLGPDGAELARVEEEGRDREVAGWLCQRIPVPRAEERSHATLYVRSWRVWPWLAALAPWVCLAAARGRIRSRRTPTGNKEGDGD